MAAPMPAPRTRSADGQVLGALLLLLGLAWLMRETGLVTLSLEATLAGLLIALGIGLVVTARSRGGRGLILLGILMTAALASTSSLDFGSIRASIGDRVFTPTSLKSGLTYNTAIGQLEIDLATAKFPEDGSGVVNAKVALGRLLVRVPDGVAVKVDANVGAGQITVFNISQGNGQGVQRTYIDPTFSEAAKKVTLRLQVGAGNIEVERAGP